MQSVVITDFNLLPGAAFGDIFFTTVAIAVAKKRYSTTVFATVAFFALPKTGKARNAYSFTLSR
jgi:hypothetical protein